MAVVLALVLLPFAERAQRAAALRMLVAFLTTLVAFVLLVFIPGQTINQSGPFAMQLLATILAFVVLSARAPWLAWMFVGVQAVTVAAVYVFTVKHDPALWPLLAICAAAFAALFGYSLYPRFAPQRAG